MQIIKFNIYNNITENNLILNVSYLTYDIHLRIFERKIQSSFLEFK